MMFDPPPRATVATLVDPAERRRLDAASHGTFAACHADSVRQVIRVVRERPVQLVLVSPARLKGEQLAAVGDLVRRFPGVSTVAVVSRHEPQVSERLLALGAHGVRRMVDLSGRRGWEQLRALMGHPTTPVAAAILTRVMPELGDASPSCCSFFQVLARIAPGTPSVRALCRRLGAPPSTFMSRFVRARLPSPKQYLATVRLVYTAHLLEHPGLSVADVAHRLEFSSPQSLGRHLRSVLGVTATEFRRRYTFDRLLGEFIARLVVPYRAAFRTFHPFGDGVRTLGHGW